MRDVPAKNYVILVVLILGVIAACFVFNNMYKNSVNTTYSSSVKEVVNQITYDDLENYLQENPDVVIYIYDDTKKNGKETDRDFKKIIVDNDIQHYVAYINKDDDVIKKYDLSSNNPIFIAYQGGVITEILNKESYSSDEIQSFLVRNKVIDSD